MKTITIKPDHTGQFQAYTKMAISGEMAVSKPFAPTLVECERKHWQEHGFKVEVKYSRFAQFQ